MDEELDIIEAENLIVLTDIPFNKKSKRDRFNVKDLPHCSPQKVGSDPNLSFNKDLQKIAQEIVKVRNELEKKTPTLDDFVMPNMCESQLVALETGQAYVSSLVEVESENICVTPLEVAKAGKTKFNQFGAIEGENTFISPVQHVRTKIPAKYAQSPYTNLSESGGTSVNTVKYCLWRHPFVNYKGLDMYSEVIFHFKKWVDSKLSKKRGNFFTAASNPINPPFESGVGRVDLMDWFHPLSYPGPWRDLHVDMIMYYLRKFCKYGPDNSARVTTTDPFFISWVVQIHDAWEVNDNDESLISIHHEVAQYIRGDGILANTPWVDVDHGKTLTGIQMCIMLEGQLVIRWYMVIMKTSHNNVTIQRKDCGLYTCAFTEYVCRGDRNVSMSGLNTENLRLRFGALLWEYGKMNIDTESVSEDEASNQSGRSNRRVKK
ncbi:hypothetical protein KY284_030148 [Solanum tuberosum]|nr:hypothetical protein KY284_030148 [Solanum tuberosum]